MPREKTPIEFKRSGFAEPQINSALDFVIGGEEAPAPAPPPAPPRVEAIPVAPPPSEVAQQAREVIRQATSVAAPPSARRTHANLEIDGELWDRFKNAVFALRLTLTDVVNEAVADKLDELERENGGPFPVRPGVNLRPGRRLG